MTKVSAIVPAHNEAATISAVVSTLCMVPSLSEVIVICDSCDDDTAALAKAAGASVCHTNEQDKARALELGIEQTDSDVFFFCDADVVHLKPALVDLVISDVTESGHEMSVLLRGRGNPVTSQLVRHLPKIGGERALTRRLWNAVPSDFIVGYKIESALNYLAHELQVPVRTRVDETLTHVPKELKYGLIPGLSARYKLCKDVTSAWLELAMKRPAPSPSHS